MSSQISKAVSGVGMLFLIIAFTALVFNGITSNSQLTNIDATGTITNETISAIDNVTNSSLAILSTNSAATCTLTSLVNATSAATVNSTNYTFYGDDCKIILTDGSDYIGEDVNITYGYTYTTNNTLSGINVNGLRTTFSLFVTAITALIVVGGTLLGVLWILPYIKPLLKKDSGIGMAA